MESEFGSKKRTAVRRLQNTVYTDDVLEANFTGIENAMTHMSRGGACAVQ